MTSTRLVATLLLILASAALAVGSHGASITSDIKGSVIGGTAFGGRYRPNQILCQFTGRCGRVWRCLWAGSAGPR